MSPELCTDFAVLEGILYHIVSNAIKYADPYTIIRLNYCLEEIVHPRLAGRLKITVVDKGALFEEVKYQKH